jgi:hypothetical protein
LIKSEKYLKRMKMEHMMTTDKDEEIDDESSPVKS